MSRLWVDTLAIPAAIEATLGARDGVEALSRELADPRTRRVIASGNGAAWYVAHALWLASLEAATPRAPLLALPAGVLRTGRFGWEPGDVLLAISTSGELRDLVELLDRAAMRPERTLLITAAPTSSLGRAAAAVATTRLSDPGAFTHSQAYAANLALGLAVLADWTADAALGRMVEGAAHAAQAGIESAADWTPRVDVDGSGALPRMVVAFGSGPAWAAALEAALLVREVGRLPAEGAETREAATSSMFGMGAADLIVALAAATDPLAAEAERVCASTGARVLRVPGGEIADARLAPIAFFPASVRLALAFAAAQDLDPDAPETAAAYYRTAR